MSEAWISALTRLAKCLKTAPRCIDVLPNDSEMAVLRAQVVSLQLMLNQNREAKSCESETWIAATFPFRNHTPHETTHGRAWMALHIRHIGVSSVAPGFPLR